MKRYIKTYINLSSEERKWLNTTISIFFNVLLIIGKIIIGFFKGVFFFASALLTLFFLFSKLFCLLGSKKENINIMLYNCLIGGFVILAGLQYALYMGRLIYSDVETFKYTLDLGVIIAFISFAELGFAIYSNIKTHTDNALLKHIKKINICSVITAMVLTESAILSFAETDNPRMKIAMTGLGASVLIILIGIYILFSKQISLCGNEDNNYVCIDDNKMVNIEAISIVLYKSKVYPEIIYQGKKENNQIKGRIVKGETPIKRWNIFLLILAIVFSELLIFPYLIGCFILSIKHHSLLKKLDSEMLKLGYRVKV